MTEYGRPNLSSTNYPPLSRIAPLAFLRILKFLSHYSLQLFLIPTGFMFKYKFCWEFMYKWFIRTDWNLLNLSSSIKAYTKKFIQNIYHLPLFTHTHTPSISKSSFHMLFQQSSGILSHSLNKDHLKASKLAASFLLTFASKMNWITSYAVTQWVMIIAISWNLALPSYTILQSSWPCELGLCHAAASLGLP